MSNPMSGADREALEAVGIEPVRDSLEAMILKLCAALKLLQERVETLENEGET